jgi:hypothetical protein
MAWHSDKLPFEMGPEDAPPGCSPETWAVILNTLYNCDGHMPLDIVEFYRRNTELDELARPRLPESVQRAVAAAEIPISPYLLLSTRWSECRMLKAIEVRVQGAVLWHNWLRYGTLPE